ncbi:unnamed protein product [Ilex paraguariensis]|uniref:C2 NT-type domain-containing protein n=1 Tax=Ilex paraguariensis TaxID=185542 RepID=A0ABC8T6L7_9AQUA
MFKSARWRSEKNKIKAVFKLQFHATQVSHIAGDALIISVVPADVGKATFRLDRATIKDGSCYWENPVYETVKFVQEPKTGKIHERIYHFVVSTGSSKAGVVGDASIDFANYAEATKISSISLPLKNAKSEALLNVSIQRMQDSIDQREVEETEYAKPNAHDRSLRAQFTNGGADRSIKSNSAEDEPFNKTISDVAEVNGNRRASSGSDVTLSSSDSGSGLDTPRELGVKKNDIHDSNGFISSDGHASVPQQTNIDASIIIYDEHQRSQWEWLGGSAPEASTDDSSSSPRGTLIQERSQEASDTVIEKFKAELAVLSRQAEMSELELQTLRKQIVKESRRVQDLSRENVSLKEERNVLKRESEKLKAVQEHINEAKVKNKVQFEGGGPQAFLEELKQELSYEKDLNANLRLQLQKTQESNCELILAVRDLDEMVEQKNREIINISNKSITSGNAKQLQRTNSQSETDVDEEQKALEELVKEHSDANEAYLLEQKVMDLCSEIEIYRRDKDELEMQMEQLALDYEILKQENHDISYKLEQSQLQEQLKMQYECSSSYAIIHELETQIESLEEELNKQSKEFADSRVSINELETHVKSLEEELEKQAQGFEADLGDLTCAKFGLETQIESLENELKKQSKEFSDSVVAINELETQVKSLEEELEKQARGFEADLEDLTRAKIEQEQRAIRAEETLRKTRWQNANTAERLQEEFRRLSLQMASTFDANEKLAMKALTEAHELRLQKSHLEEMLLKANEELQSVRDSYEDKLDDLSSQIASKMNQIEQMQSKVDDKSKQLEHTKNHDEETHRSLSQEIRMLRAEMVKLTKENNILSDQAEEKETLRAELEQMKASIMEAEMLSESQNTEKIKLQNTITLMKKEMENLLEELNVMRCLNEEKEFVVGNLQLEVESFKVQCDELRHTLMEDELESGKLRKQVLQLKADLKKKENAFNGIEKQLKDSSGRATGLDVTKSISRNNRSIPAPRSSKEIVNQKEKIKFLEDKIKQKETALETSTNKFLEKEKDLQNKIDDLERRLEELDRNSTSICEYECGKVAEEAGDLTQNGNTSGNLSIMPSMSNGSRKSMDEILTEKEQMVSAIDTKDQTDLQELLNEMAILKERNKLMECELKEMQERYSEISLKFAEVEGERQQLVMTVRNLKNTKKS